MLFSIVTVIKGTERERGDREREREIQTDRQRREIETMIGR